MSTNSDIEWTTHTFNPWWGCTKVHAGCKNCYAEAQDHRWGGNHWGNSPRRMVLGEWGKPAKWDAAAKAAGRVDSVFCASMCDLFEDYHGRVVNQQGEELFVGDTDRITRHGTAQAVTLDWLRMKVFEQIHVTPNLRWLLLTKRPENIMRMVPPLWLERWPANAWTGTSPCDQATADECIPNLLRVPGPHFLSCEPLLGPIIFNEVLEYNGYDGRGVRRGTIDCVIVGGESGTKARPCDVGWIRSIVGQCKDAGVPCFVKQLGASIEMAFDEWNRITAGGVSGSDRFTLLFEGCDRGYWRTFDRKGGDMAEWPEDLRVREVPA